LDNHDHASVRRHPIFAGTRIQTLLANIGSGALILPGQTAIFASPLVDETITSSVSQGILVTH
jgi:hypothetical protein